VALPYASLTDMLRKERLFCQFNPETLDESLEVDWTSHLPLGGSREISHYNGTRSVRIPLTLYFTIVGRPGNGVPGFSDLLVATSEAGGSPGIEFGLAAAGQRGPAVVRQSLAGPERFLKALCYKNGGPGARGGFSTEPPTVIFDWPGIVRLEGHLLRLRTRYQQFSTEDLRGLFLVAETEFREDAAEGIGNEDVRVKGSNRSPTLLPHRIQEPPEQKLIVQFTRPGV